MRKKQTVVKSGDTWEWEETPETIEALKQLHKTVVNNRVNRPHDYQDPLYAPQPNIKKLEEDAAPDYGVGK